MYSLCVGGGVGLEELLESDEVKKVVGGGALSIEDGRVRRGKDWRLGREVRDSKEDLYIML